MACEEQGQGHRNDDGAIAGDLSDDGENMDMEMESDMESDTELEEDAGEGAGSRTPEASFKPYRSILPGLSRPSPGPSLSPPIASGPRSSPIPRKRRRIEDTRSTQVIPPWRSALGRGYFSLDNDENDLELPLTIEAEDLYIQILESTFAHFSDRPVGLDTTLMEDVNNGATDVSWEADVTPQWGVIEGDSEVLYTSLPNLTVDDTTGISTPSKASSSRM